MRSIGLIEFEDIDKNVRVHYVRDAVSLNALKAFALIISGFSKMNLNQVTWSPDAEVVYLTDISAIHQNKSPWKFSFLVNPTTFKFKPAIPGQISEGYTWQFIASLCFHSTQSRRVWRKIAIPAPVFSVFHSARVRSDIGNAILPSLRALLGGQVLTFSSGYMRMTQPVEEDR